MKTFLYLHCTDLASARTFYTEVLGLDEIYHSEVDRSVGYRAGDLQITITHHAEATDDVRREWSRQLGWEGGSEPTPSWGLELSGTAFCRAVDAVRTLGHESFADEPRWVGYWSFPVKDPMGNTVELSTPTAAAWPATN